MIISISLDIWKIDLNYREKFQTNFERLYKKKQVLQTSRPLPNIALHKIRESLSIEWTYNSNSIEGNTMSLRETQIVFQDGITIKGKSLREHFEAYNHDKAIDCLYSIVNEDYNLISIGHFIFLRTSFTFHRR
jgi:Fic family protein